VRGSFGSLRMLHGELVEPSPLPRTLPACRQARSHQGRGKKIEVFLENIITYSKSYTLVLTHSCANQCLYCGFRKKDEGIITFSDAEEIIKTAKEKGHWEILVMSGEKPQKIRKVSSSFKNLGYKDFTSFALDICKLILKNSLLPHTNIGVLSCEGLNRLKRYNASMGIMLENINMRFGRTVHPQKNINERLRVIKDAGKLRIPFTTGILIGLGEAREDRRNSLKAIIELHNKYNHIQEIILQNFTPNRRSKIRIPDPITAEDWQELIRFVKDNSDIPVQIPQNLNQDYTRMIKFGASDLGGISEGEDHVNLDSRWVMIEEISKNIESSGHRLKGRLPIYKKYFNLGWYSEEVGNVIKKYLEMEEFAYYKSPQLPLTKG